MQPEDRSQTRLSTAIRCGIYGAGVIGALLVYGLFQERIMQISYGGSFFTFSTFLVLCNRICNACFAIVMSGVKRDSLWNQVPLWKYFIISFSNVAATSCQYEALKYVSFPVQMLGKSFKMMPVMIWGIIISGKRYTLTDWLVAAAITVGVTEFLMTGNISSPSKRGSSFFGLLLLVAFLGCDGLTSTFQEKLFKEHNTTKYNQMFYVNIFSALTSLLILLATDTLLPALTFCGDHPGIVRDAAVLSASATTGQFFIYSQVHEFGALAFAATMNVRQVVSILVSYVRYGHTITILQVVGLVMVFGALFYKSYIGLMASEPERTPVLGERWLGLFVSDRSPLESALAFHKEKETVFAFEEKQRQAVV